MMLMIYMMVFRYQYSLYPNGDMLRFQAMEHEIVVIPLWLANNIEQFFSKSADMLKCDTHATWNQR